MESSDTPDASRPPPQGRSSIAGLVVVGALLGFGALLFLANFSGQISDPARSRPVTDDPFSTGKVKGVKGKGKGKGGKVAKVPDAQLLHVGDPIEKPAPPPGARNVVVVITTAVRRDALTPYGAEPHATPFLGELASDGARFADFVSASPFSRTAGVALLTGRHAAAVDAVEPGPGPDRRALPTEVDTLAERLRAAGWATYGVSSNFNYNASAGLAQGFDRYRDAQPAGFAAGARLEGQGVVKHAAAMLAERSEADKARPFYLQVTFVDAHQPLRMIPDQLEDFGGRGNKQAPYKAAVKRVDGFVRDLVSELDAQGYEIGKDTYVAVVSDHGEGNDEPAHHGKQHGRLLFDTSVVVPWIVDGPDVPPNRIVSGIASGVDFMPTVLDLVGVAKPEGIDGISWADQIRGKSDRTTRDEAFSDTWYFTANRASIWTEAKQCQKDFGSVDLKDAFADGCFDRRTDPSFTNLIEDPALLSELVAWRAEVSKHVTASAPSGDDEPSDDPAEQDVAPEGEGEDEGEGEEAG